MSVIEITARSFADAFAVSTLPSGHSAAGCAAPASLACRAGAAEKRRPEPRVAAPRQLIYLRQPLGTGGLSQLGQSALHPAITPHQQRLIDLVERLLRLEVKQFSVAFQRRAQFSRLPQTIAH